MDAAALPAGTTESRLGILAMDAYFPSTYVEQVELGALCFLFGTSKLVPGDNFCHASKVRARPKMPWP